jgi:hypothetical protein
MLDKSIKNDGLFPDYIIDMSSSNDVSKQSSESKKKELGEAITYFKAIYFSIVEETKIKLTQTLMIEIV